MVLKKSAFESGSGTKGRVLLQIRGLVPAAPA
jgi:hypothetical protein